MKPRNLFNKDDRGVSPVIGVILMVAITVILAAVIGTFVLGLGDSLGDSQPTAQLNVDVEESTSTVTLTHDGGDSIAGGDLRMVVTDVSSGNTVEGTVPNRISVGDSFTGSNTSAGISVADSSDYRVRVIHQPSDSIILDRTFQSQQAFDLGSLTLN